MVRRLDKHGLFPEARGQVSVGIGDAITDGLGKVAQGGSAVPGLCGAVISASTSSGTTIVISYLAQNSVELDNLVLLVASPHRDEGNTKES